MAKSIELIISKGLYPPSELDQDANKKVSLEEAAQYVAKYAPQSIIYNDPYQELAIIADANYRESKTQVTAQQFLDQLPENFRQKILGYMIEDPLPYVQAVPEGIKVNDQFVVPVHAQEREPTQVEAFATRECLSYLWEFLSSRPALAEKYKPKLEKMNFDFTNERFIKRFYTSVHDTFSENRIEFSAGPTDLYEGQEQQSDYRSIMIHIFAASFFDETKDVQDFIRFVFLHPRANFLFQLDFFETLNQNNSQAITPNFLLQLTESWLQDPLLNNDQINAIIDKAIDAVIAHSDGQSQEQLSLIFKNPRVSAALSTTTINILNSCATVNDEIQPGLKEYFKNVLLELVKDKNLKEDSFSQLLSNLRGPFLEWDDSQRNIFLDQLMDDYHSDLGKLKQIPHLFEEGFPKFPMHQLVDYSQKVMSTKMQNLPKEVRVVFDRVYVSSHLENKDVGTEHISFLATQFFSNPDISLESKQELIDEMIAYDRKTATRINVTNSRRAMQEIARKNNVPRAVLDKIEQEYPQFQ